MLPVSRVQGKPTRAATGRRAAQKPSIRMVQITGAHLLEISPCSAAAREVFRRGRLLSTSFSSNSTFYGCTSRQRLQSLWQLLINAAETAVRQNRDYIPRAHFGRDQLHDPIHLGNDACAPAMFLYLC